MPGDGDPARHPGGRPSKLTRQLIGDLERIVGQGNYIETAAAYLGVSKDSLYRWLRDGREHRNQGRRTLAAQFSYALDRAQAQAELLAVATIQRAMEGHTVRQREVIDPETGEIRTLTEHTWAGDWRAAAWRLERQHSDRWTAKTKIEGDVNVNISDDPKQALLDRMAAIAARATEDPGGPEPE